VLSSHDEERGEEDGWILIGSECAERTMRSSEARGASTCSVSTIL